MTRNISAAETSHQRTTDKCMCLASRVSKHGHNKDGACTHRLPAQKHILLGADAALQVGADACFTKGMRREPQRWWREQRVWPGYGWASPASAEPWRAGGAAPRRPSMAQKGSCRCRSRSWAWSVVPRKAACTDLPQVADPNNAWMPHSSAGAAATTNSVGKRRFRPP